MSRGNGTVRTAARLPGWLRTRCRFSRRPLTLAPVVGNHPRCKYRSFLRAAFVVDIDHPGRIEIVEIASKSKTAASPFEGLGLRRSHRVIFVGPLFAGSGVCSESVDGHLASHEDLAGNDLGVAFGTRDVVHRGRLVVGSSPAG